jgi:hypothetical protein
MTKSLVRTAPLFTAILFVVGLIFFDQARAEQPRTLPARLISTQCKGLHPSAFSHCRQAALQNSWARVNGQRKRALYPTFKKYTAYRTARERLLQLNWESASDSHADQCIKDDARCEGFPEMQSCSGTSQANCLFLWKKAGTLIAVSTIDDPPVIEAVECRAHCR